MLQNVKDVWSFPKRGYLDLDTPKSYIFMICSCILHHETIPFWVLPIDVAEDQPTLGHPDWSSVYAKQANFTPESESRLRQLCVIV